MRILHIAPSAPYNEGWGYQENLLPKYQARMGHEVTLVTTDLKQENGTLVHTPLEDYLSPSGFRVVRRPVRQPPIGKAGALFAHLEVRDLLEEIAPDFVFIHGLVSATVDQVTSYKRHCRPDMVIVLDNHLDWRIGTLHLPDWKNRLLRANYRHIYRRNDHWIAKVYGVTPWRERYAREVFGVPAEKTGVLIMGADDEALDFAHKAEIRKEIREKYAVEENDFLIVTGGRIDENKGIHLLMEAVGNMPDVKLMVFGSAAEDIRQRFDALCRAHPNIVNIGWVASGKVYNLFFAADLVFFPGQHSVLWEQACASKVPCVFRRWDGMEHVNNGGSAEFIDEVTPECIAQKIRALRSTAEYFAMKAAAESEKTDIYLYSRIAKQSLESLGETR